MAMIDVRPGRVRPAPENFLTDAQIAANAAFARQFLERENIPKVFEDLEGTQARRIQFRPVSGQVRARLVPSDVAPTEKPLGRPQSALGTVELF